MKEFFVQLGGKERRLRYTSRDGIELKKRFGKHPAELMGNETLLGFRPKNGEKDKVEFSPAFDLEAQGILLLLGLRHDDKEITEETIFGKEGEPGWLDELIMSGRRVTALMTAVKAAAYHGVVTGLSVDLDESAAELAASKAIPTSPAS